MKNSKERENFDVLCLIKGKKKRLPFKDRGDHSVIGIFPFSDEPAYIELEETENKAHKDKDVKERHLPDVDFCERLSEIIKPLNACLTMLNSPTLQGCYLADSSYMRGTGWIIKFYPDKPGTLDSDYYGGSERAKCRYVKKFRNWLTLF